MIKALLWHSITKQLLVQHDEILFFVLYHQILNFFHTQSIAEIAETQQ